MTYILSSKTFKTKEDVIKRLTGWLNSGNLHSGCKVYKVKIEKVFKLYIKKEIKLKEE